MSVMGLRIFVRICLNSANASRSSGESPSRGAPAPPPVWGATGGFGFGFGLDSSRQSAGNLRQVAATCCRIAAICRRSRILPFLRSDPLMLFPCVQEKIGAAVYCVFTDKAHAYKPFDRVLYGFPCYGFLRGEKIVSQDNQPTICATVVIRGHDESVEGYFLEPGQRINLRTALNRLFQNSVSQTLFSPRVVLEQEQPVILPPQLGGRSCPRMWFMMLP